MERSSPNRQISLPSSADRYEVPVASTLRAKGVLSEAHRLSLGVFGYAGTRHSTAALLGWEHPVEVTQCTLALGTSLNQRDTMRWADDLTPIYGLHQIDLNPKVFGRNYPTSHTVVGDARTFIEELLADPELDSILSESKQARAEWCSRIMALDRYYDSETRRSNTSPVHPARVVGELQKAAHDLETPPVLVVDSGAHRAFFGHHWRATEPRRYLSSTALAPMGWAIPAGIGAKTG